MSRVDYGQIEVVLGEESVLLKPTLSAMQSVDRNFGSIREAIASVRNLNLDALVSVIVGGAGLDQETAKGLPEKVFAAGVLNVAGPVSEYLLLLMNPGGAKRKEGQGKGKL